MYSRHQILFLFLLLHSFLFCQTSAIVDPFFNQVESGLGQGQGFTSGSSRSSALLSDGKLIVAGVFNQYNGYDVNNIVRLNSNGALDFSFQSLLDFDGAINSIAVQSDGKILVAGEFTTINGVSKKRLARLNSNGSLDNSFNVGQGFDSTVRKILIQSDGKIYAGGLFTTFNGYARNGIVKIHENGIIDLSFVSGFGNDADVYNFLEVDGKILVGGYFSSYAGNTVNNIVKLNQSGARDLTFNQFSLGPNASVTAIFKQEDGRLIIGGTFSNYNGETANKLVRVFGNGEIDPTFDVQGGPNTGISDIIQISPNSIVVSGGFNQFSTMGFGAIAIIDSLGNLLQGMTGWLNNVVHDLNLTSDNKIIAVGDFTFGFNLYARNRICQFTSSGDYDFMYNPIIGFDKEVFDYVIGSDNKIYVCGAFNRYNGILSARVARLHPNGDFDSTFLVGNVLESFSEINSIEVQSDGKVLLGSSHITRLTQLAANFRHFRIKIGFHF